jgi:asparagine synthase (glutamine-hydrolysing)
VAEAIVSLPVIYDEPFSDASEIPTYLVSRFARQHVTVCLTGDGGDELLGGYNRHYYGQRLWELLRPAPGPARWIGSAGLRSMSRAIPDDALRAVERLFGVRFPPQLGYKLYKLAGLLGADSPRTLYREIVSHWQEPEKIVLGATEPVNPCLSSSDSWQSRLSVSEWMIYADFLTYLPDDILVKTDRASMAVSLEVRAPFVDHELVEFAWSLPVRFKIRNGKGKWLLRRLLEKFVPPHLFERPKQGFSVPLDYWLRGPLRDWAEDLLSEERLKGEGIFNHAAIRKEWRNFLKFGAASEVRLWGVLAFQAWWEDQSKRDRA